MVDFLDTSIGKVPQVATEPEISDRMGYVLTRSGLIRNNYKISPGLYAVGKPEDKSPVLVTANYKLTFDTLRFTLKDIDCWILVVDTRGINVWCAAGKGTFSASEIATMVNSVKLQDITLHRELIVPQLGAVGVSANKVKEFCGFRIHFGPIRAEDIPRYLKNGKEASEEMRSVTFSLKERCELIPVELYLQLKTLAIISIIAVILSGIGPHFYSIDVTIERSIQILSATLMGLVSGSVIVPIFLRFLPGRQFWIKGIWPPLLFFCLFMLLTDNTFSLENFALMSLASAYGSFLAMNFTGCTPYTSPSGVEFEMKHGIPVQILLTVFAIVIWITVPFLA